MKYIYTTAYITSTVIYTANDRDLVGHRVKFRSGVAGVINPKVTWQNNLPDL
jgi:hypothetical protein